MIIPAQKRKPRRGAAFLLLVVLVMLAVLGASRSVLTSEITHRRAESDQHRIRIMSRAIDALAPIANELSEPVSLPINKDMGEFIEVVVDASKTKLVAQWRRGDEVLDEMTKTIKTETTKTETQTSGSESNE